MKAGIKAGILSFIIITILFAISYHFELYKLNSIFQLFPLTVAPFLGVYFTIKNTSETTFTERFKGGIQSSLITGLFAACLYIILSKLSLLKLEQFGSNNLFIDFGQIIQIFALSGALIGALFSALLYKKEKA